MADNDAIVTDFGAAWGRGDVDAIMAHFTDDAVYHNMPMEPQVGVADIRAFITGFLGTSTIEFITHRQTVNGDVVMNERTDVFHMGDKTISLPVMGVFELRDGKIAAWRDYFDMGAFS